MIRTLFYFLLAIPFGAFAIADAARHHNFTSALFGLIFAAQVVTLFVIARRKLAVYVNPEVDTESPLTPSGVANRNHYAGNAHQRRIARRAARVHQFTKAQGA